jgi:dihydrofolate reductase
MRKIIFMMSVSLDGFFEGPDRELDWQIVDEELPGHFNEWLSGMSAFLDGRVTYELIPARSAASSSCSATCGHTRRRQGRGMARLTDRHMITAGRDHR